MTKRLSTQCVITFLNTAKVCKKLWLITLAHLRTVSSLRGQIYCCVLWQMYARIMLYVLLFCLMDCSLWPHHAWLNSDFKAVRTWVPFRCFTYFCVCIPVSSKSLISQAYPDWLRSQLSSSQQAAWVWNCWTCLGSGDPCCVWRVCRKSSVGAQNWSGLICVCTSLTVQFGRTFCANMGALTTGASTSVRTLRELWQHIATLTEAAKQLVFK